MRNFMDKDFMLYSGPAQRLYHDYAEDMPIFDYHSHLPAAEIADDVKFENISQMWLNHDHYKWRAMRSNGIEEKFCTGNASDMEKFEKWAQTVVSSIGNPLYHWTHMELKNYFGITKLLCPETSGEIYEICSAKLKKDGFSVRNLLKKMNVRAVCTTDDPVDSLKNHKKIMDDKFDVKVLPTFRPDKSFAVEDARVFVNWIKLLEKSSNFEIRDFNSFINALKSRHDYFHEMGCRISDRGLDTLYAENYTDKEITHIFKKIYSGNNLDVGEIKKFKSAMLYLLALMDHEKAWTMQLHIGALRNNNSRLFKIAGPDSGFDSIGDILVANPLSEFLDRLDSDNHLPKTILYNLNPRDNELYAAMIGNFQDGSIPGKIQYGSGWWFLDQKHGMEKQLSALANLGLLSRFVGMLTDSRSFLSFPRHEYFRRILCNKLGQDMENGEIPGDFELIGSMVRNICFNNAKDYFGIKLD
ncbi:MAG: glucuronate isomerase [bacterium]